MVLELNRHHIQMMMIHAEQTYPDECCGLLLGHRADRVGLSIKSLLEVYPTVNAWEAHQQAFVSADAQSTTRRRYAIDPQVLLTAQKSARNSGLEIIGFYHSHPDQPAVPSECDRVWAWPFYSYIIIAVHQGRAQDLQSWELGDERHVFQLEDLRSPSLS